MKIYEIGTGYTSIPAKIPAATEIIIEHLTSALADCGEDVAIIDIKDKDRLKTALPIIEINVPLITQKTDISLGIMHKINRVLYSINAAKKIKKIIKDTNEQIILHFHNQYNMFFFLKMTTKAERKNCICAYTNHSGIWNLDWNKIKGTVKKRYFQELKCMKMADVLFVLNKKTAENITKYIGVEKSKIKLISNGVNTDIYFPLDFNEIETIKNKYNLQNKIVLLQIGSINENKGQYRALQLLLPLFNEYDNFVYVYAGGIVDKEYHEKLNTFVKKNNLTSKVKYLGMLKPGKQLNEVYNMADAMILPSLYESFSLVTIEAFSSGLPVFVDENTEIPIKSGLLYYTPQTITDIFKENIINNETKKYKIKANARNIALTEYSWHKIAKDYIRVWKNYENTDACKLEN